MFTSQLLCTGPVFFFKRIMQNPNVSLAGDVTVVILPDPGASGVISIIPASRAVIIGEPGEYSSSYDGTTKLELNRATGVYGEITVTWAITPRDSLAFMQFEGSVTFADLQKTAYLTLQVICVCVLGWGHYLEKIVIWVQECLTYLSPPTPTPFPSRVP
jgi:hypothetical protein